MGGALGNTDTIVLRSQGITSFSPPSGTGTIDIELVALSLVSVSPVDLTPLGGPFIGVSADLHVTINKETEDIGAAGGNDDGVCDGGETCTTVAGIAQPDALNPSIGQMKVNHTVADGGDFDSCYGEITDPGSCSTLGVAGGGVFADSIFTVVGGDPNNALDLLISQAADRITLSGAGNKWSHTSPPFAPPSPIYPAGGFFAGVDPGTGGNAVGITHTGPHPNLDPASVPPVGGIALVDSPDSPASPADGSGSSVGLYAALAGALAAGVFAITASGWYASRRFRQGRADDRPSGRLRS